LTAKFFKENIGELKETDKEALPSKSVFNVKIPRPRIVMRLIENNSFYFKIK
jgi:hypothetical protein